MSKTKIKRRPKVPSLSVLFVAADNPDCSIVELAEAVKREFEFNEAEFQYAVDYSFVPSRVAELLQRGWLLRKWTGSDYIFSVTAAGKAELARN